jgi:hypothetical protein
MKTEEILRYEAEYQAMQEAFGTHLLTFDFAKTRKALERKGECPSPLIKAKRREPFSRG